MKQISDRQYEDIGRIVVHEVLKNRKVNRALSQSPYGIRIAYILRSEDYGKTEQLKKQSLIKKLLSWIKTKKS